MWFRHWCGEINEPFKNSDLELLHLFVIYSGSAQNLPPCPIIKSSIWCLEEKSNYLYQERVIPRFRCGQRLNGGQGGNNSSGTESLWGRRKDSTMPQVGYFLQFSAFASERHQVRTRGRQTFFLSRAPSSLVTPLGVVGLTTNHKPTLSSHKSLMSINVRKDMIQKKVQFYFEVIYVADTLWSVHVWLITPICWESTMQNSSLSH